MAEELFEMFGQAFQPSSTKEIKWIKTRISKGSILVELGTDLTINYVRVTHMIYTCRGTEILRTDEVTEDYTVDMFLDLVEHYRKIFGGK